MIHIGQGELKRIYSHAQRTWPNECCGALLGKIHANPVVTEIRSMDNMVGRDAQWKYMIAPEMLLGLEKQAEMESCDVVGFYHSHPHGGPRPSSSDLHKAWPGYSYLIVGCGRGEPYDTQCWILQPDGKGFVEQSMIISE